MKKRLFSVFKKSNYKYFRVFTTRGSEIENEELITLRALKLRIKNYSKDFENGLININDVDDYSVMFLASFTIEDLRDNNNTVDIYLEGVIVHVK